MVDWDVVVGLDISETFFSKGFLREGESECVRCRWWFSLLSSGSLSTHDHVASRGVLSSLSPPIYHSASVFRLLPQYI